MVLFRRVCVLGIFVGGWLVFLDVGWAVGLPEGWLFVIAEGFPVVLSKDVFGFVITRVVGFTDLGGLAVDVTLPANADLFIMSWLIWNLGFASSPKSFTS